MYKIKKKRPVDPNAPPRPNLMSHDKVIRDQKVTIDQQQEQIQSLKRRLDALETKMSNQSSYLTTLHSHISRQK
jgi:uncharacterized coiled-coil protein SlyX